MAIYKNILYKTIISDLCPDGVGQPPVHGVKSGDQWTAIEGDGIKDFVQIGTWSYGDPSETCTKLYDRHYKHLNRETFERDVVSISYVENFGYCCPVRGKLLW